MTCKICGGPSKAIFRRKILGKHDVHYFQCGTCYFVQTEEPFWLKEAYEESINIEDTGVLERNILFAKRTAAILYTFFDKRGSFLDYGGGYGLFVRLMRDYGFDFYWSDPMTKNMFARGFEFDPQVHQSFELITTFECMEHFINPREEVDRMLQFSDSLLFSTETFSRTAPPPDQWDFYGFSHGQHISLFSEETLQHLARAHRLYLCSNRKSFHLLSKKKLNNKLFNIVLKTSLVGIPGMLRLFQRGKWLSDARLLREKRLKGLPGKDESRGMS